MIKGEGIRVILFLTSVGFIFDLYSLFLISNGSDNIIFYNVFNLIESACLLLFFYVLPPLKKAKIYILVSFIVFVLFWLFMFISKGRNKFLDSAVNFEYVFVLVFSLFFLFQLLKKPEEPIFSNSHFWIVSAYMLYVAGTFFLYLFIYSLTPEEQNEYYVVNFIFIIIKTILLSIAMFVKPKAQERKKFQLT